MTPSSILSRSRIEIKLGSYGVGPATLLSDPTILPRVQEYRRQASSRMHPTDRDEILNKVPRGDYHVSRKIDGEFNVLVLRDGELFTLNPGGTLRVGMPWLDEAAKQLAAAGVQSAMLAGELYVQHDDGRRARVHDIVSVARQPGSQTELETISFAVFDIIALDGDEYGEEKPFRERWDWIEKTFGKGKRAHSVQAACLKTPEEIRQQFVQWVETESAEGLVVRSDVGGQFKIKPRHNLDAVVLGFTESTNDREGMLHDLLLGVRRADGTYQVLCRVGGGFSDDQRREILSDLKDRIVESEYAEVNSDRVAYQMVRPDWVVEISYLDLVAQTTRGGSINRMVLEYFAEESPAFQVVRRLPLAAVISPQFIRRREDKQADTTDVRIDQIADRVDLPMADQDARQLKLPTSTVMQREVYVKEQKGGTMVRKFVMWRTNKQAHSDEFPGYVIHYTDFSPNRKEPLDRDIRITNSQEQAEMLWNQLKKQNIKSGWKAAEELAPSTDESTPVAQPKKRMAASERPKKTTRKKKSS